MTDTPVSDAMASAQPAPRRRRLRWEAIGDHIVLILGALLVLRERVPAKYDRVKPSA